MEKQDGGPSGSDVPERDEAGSPGQTTRGWGSRIFVLKGGGWGGVLGRHPPPHPPHPPTGQGTCVLLTDRNSDSGKIGYHTPASTA